MKPALKIIYENGTVQVIQPSEMFDGRYDLLAYHIAKGHPHKYVILK